MNEVEVNLAATMNYFELLQLDGKRRSFAKISIIICTLSICRIGATVSVANPADSINEGQSLSSSNSLLNWLWIGRMHPQTETVSSARDNVSESSAYYTIASKATINVEPFCSNRDLGPAELESQQVEGLGSIKLIGGGRSNFFSCSFGIYSRTKSIAEIKSKNNAEHLFDLNELVPENSIFNASRRTVVLIPGYRSVKYVQWMHDAKNLWLELEDVNVILVHWYEGSNGLYTSAVENTRIVGRQIVILLYYLAKLNYVDFKSEQFGSKLILIGHSCGAHIAGFVGKELAGKVDRITGLDPAGPIFATLNPSDRLNAKNAKFVDIIHTNSGKSLDTTELYKLLCQCWVKQKLDNLKELFSFSKSNKNQTSLNNIVEQAMQMANITVLSNENNNKDPSQPIITYGIEEQIGHVDYYVNGGSVQPGCEDLFSICDHNRAIDIYLRILEHQLGYKRQAAYNCYSSSGEALARDCSASHKQPDLYRLIAFAANDYEEYKTGASLVRNCPEISLSSPAAGENLSGESFDEAFKRCTIPIDLAKSADEYRKELPAEATSGDNNRTTRYYFDTLAHDPLVSDYYLMRLHVPSLAYKSQDQVSGIGQCMIFSSLHSLETNNKHRFSTQLVEYKPWNYTMSGNYYSYLFIGLVLPILNPNNLRLYFPTRQYIHQQIRESNKSDAAAIRLRFMLPNALSIGLVQSRKQLQANVNSVTNNNNTQTNCVVSYSDIELSPLTKALKGSFSLWFSSGTNDDCKAELNRATAPKPIMIDKLHKVNHSVSLDLTGQVCNIPLKEISLLSLT